MSVLVVRKVTGVALVQDLGRTGFASQGVPRGGAFVRSWLVRANAAVGNEGGAAAIEIFGRLTIATDSDRVIATERGDRRALPAGDELAIDPDATCRVRYLAMEGGVDVPLVLGSRSTLLVAGLGGFEGRPLRAGDRLALFPARRADPPRESAIDAEKERTGVSIRVVAGPDDAAAFGSSALESLMGQAWRIDPRSDRTGTRLSGSAISRVPSDSLRSSPMVAGAIQVPADGMPIVLGPDGPTTGGYPLLAVVAAGDLDRFHGLPLGASVRFCPA